MVRWKVLRGNIQLAISEMKISFPNVFGHFNFQLRYPNRSNSCRRLKYLFRQTVYITRSPEMSLKGFRRNLLLAWVPLILTFAGGTV